MGRAEVALATTGSAVASSIDATLAGPKSHVCGSVMTIRGRSRPWWGDVGRSAWGHRRR